MTEMPLHWRSKSHFNHKDALTSMKNTLLLILTSLVLTLTGCATLSPVSIPVSPEYHLGAGDEISIQVYDAPGLSMRVTIGPGGMINYPYLGEVKLQGQTTEQLVQTLTQGLQDGYLVNPQVTVNITRFRDVYIGGEVENPGAYAYRPGLTVEKLIALAGGFTDRADRQAIELRTSTSQENPAPQGNTAKVPSDAGQKSSPSRVSPVSLEQKLRPDDLVTVAQSFF
ncbi:polysaccharide export protein [Plesiomonas shigelloides]|nr:polysaccharide export protein [Plesiomonas shigelloides]